MSEFGAPMGTTMEMGYGPVPPDLLEGTIALPRGLVGSPEAGYSAVVDYMPEGYAIERNPVPITTEITPGPSPEDILESLIGPSDPTEPTTPRFEPYGPHMDYDTRDSTLAKDIALTSEEGIVKPVLVETDQTEEIQPTDKEAGRGMNLLRTLRRSRLGQLAAVTAIAAGELLSLGTSSAQASDLTPEEVQACTDAALAHPTVMNRPAIYRAGIRGKQTLRGALGYEELPGYCAPEYMRVGSGQLEIKEHGRWVKIGPVTAAGAWGNRGGRYDVEYSPSHTPGPAYIYDECIGGKFEKARLVLTESLRTGENGHRKVVDSKRYVMPLDVNGSCRAAVRSRERYHQ